LLGIFDINAHIPFPVIRRLSPWQAFSAFALLLLVALLALYWPIMRADFAWDELLDSLPASPRAASTHGGRC
jgi:NADH:ubiquinone oxidoreductase subunit 3 (subunit A)